MIQKKYKLMFFLPLTMAIQCNESFCLTPQALTEAAAKIGTTTVKTDAVINTAKMPQKTSFDSKLLFKFLLPENDDSKRQIVQMIKYDKDIYELAYMVYLQTNNSKKAYAVAMAATKQDPSNRLWKERLAQVALWNEEASVALEQYLDLNTNFNDIEAGEKGKKLAKLFHEDDLLVRFLAVELKKQNQDHKIPLWLEYIEAMLRLGEIDKLIEVLNVNKNHLPKRLYLETMARIYLILDDPSAQLAILKELSSAVGMNPAIAEAMAKIYVIQGDSTQAASVMNQARQKVQGQEFKFWKAYATIAHLGNQTSNELYGLQQLLKEKKPSLDIYSRLIELTARSQPLLAYQYAEQGIVQYPNNYYLATAIFSLMTKNKSLDFPKLAKKIPAPVMHLLKYDPSYWHARAYYWKQMKNEGKVLQSYVKGMKYVSEDSSFKSEFLYYLIETNNMALLKQSLPLWQSDVPGTQRLWGPYAEAYARLDNPTMTRLFLNLFYQQFKEHDKDPYWLILFKDTLENAFFDRESNEINFYTWPYYLGLLRNQSVPPDYVQLVNYVKLSLLNAFGDSTAVALAMLEKYQDKDVELLMLTWAIGQNNIALARLVHSHYKQKGIEPPLWASLSIALARNDQPAIRKILMDKKEIVSYRDRIKAAIRIKALPYAQSYAYKALKRYRKDYDLYDNFFTPLMLDNAKNIYFSQEYYQYGNVIGPRTVASYTHFLFPSLSLTPYNSIWFSQNIGNKSRSFIDENNNLNVQRNQILRTVPSRDERVGVKFHTIQRRGALDLDWGYRDNLSSFMTAELTHVYKLYNDLDLTGIIGYHQPADDTAGMLVGGMKNNLELDFDYKLFFKDHISGYLQQNFFYTQQRQYLANGTQLFLRYEHKFWKSYPDWTVATYGVITKYYNKTKALLQGSVLKIIPINTDPTVDFLIPADFREYGITFSFGQNFIEDYTHRWRPFAAATISKNSVVGIGKLFNIGIGGIVFGRDHLLVYYEWGTNQGQGIQTAQLAKMSYRIYF